MKVITVLLVLVLLCSPVMVAGEVCEEALSDCAVDAVLAGVLGGAASGLLYASGCFMGYTWCLKYYD